MRRFAILLLMAISATAVISATQPAPGCDLLKHLFHRCKACYHCGAHKCHYAKCHRPKCHCGGVRHSHGYAPHGHGHHYQYYRPKRRHHGYYNGPAYAEPSAPVYEVPPGRDF